MILETRGFLHEFLKKLDKKSDQVFKKNLKKYPKIVDDKGVGRMFLPRREGLMGKKKVITTLKLDPMTLEQIDEIAELNYMNRSETIRKMLELFVLFHSEEEPLQYLQYTQNIRVELPTVSRTPQRPRVSVAAAGGMPTAVILPDV